MWNCIVEPENYPVSPHSVNVTRPGERGERGISPQSEWLPLEKVRIIRITHPTPLSQPSSVELSLSPFSDMSLT